MNQKPYNKQLINLICSVCTEKYLPSSFLFTPRSFVLRSVRKLHAGKYKYFALIKHLMMYFVIVFRISLAYFLSNDFFSRIYINSLNFLFIQCFSLTNGQRSKRQTLLSISAVHQPFYILISISTLTCISTFLYYELYLDTAQYAGHYILCFSLTKGLLWKRQTSCISTLRLYQYVCLLTGIRNANVFPEPVCAAHSMSSPFNATGIPCLRISVGLRYPQLSSFRIKTS